MSFSCQWRLKKTKWVGLLQAVACHIDAIYVANGFPLPSSPVQAYCSHSFLLVSVIPLHFTHFAAHRDSSCHHWVPLFPALSEYHQVLSGVCFLLREGEFCIISLLVTALKNLFPAYYLLDSFNLSLLFRVHPIHVKYVNFLLLFNNIQQEVVLISFCILHICHCW